MAIRTKIIHIKSLKRVFLKKARKPADQFHFGRFVLYLGDIRDKGYFYNREWIRCAEPEENNFLWQKDKKMMEDLQITSQWLKYPVAEICMEFVHFLTKEKVYLQIQWQPYDYKNGGRVTMQLRKTNGLQNNRNCASENMPPYFEKILKNCEVLSKQSEMQEISEFALRSKPTDTLFTVLTENGYAQRKVGRITCVTESETRVYWAGEFLNENAEGDTEKYLYLVQKTEVKQKPGTQIERFMNYMTGPEWYLMRMENPVEEICLNDGTSIELQEMLWRNRPFKNYYDLPLEDFVSYRELKKSREVTGKKLHEILEELYRDGYRYRRELVWEASDKEKEMSEVIGKDLMAASEFSECVVERIQMEFIKQNTGERKFVNVEPQEISISLCNGYSGENTSGYHTTCFRSDQSMCSRYYAEEKRSPFEEEVILPGPVFQSLLEQHHLITNEQVRLCHIMGKREFQEWFGLSIPCLEGDLNQEETEALRKEELRKAGKVRRIARGLRYHLQEICKQNDYKVEVYANDEGNRAIYLIDQGVTLRVKFVDAYMDVNGALQM